MKEPKKSSHKYLLKLMSLVLSSLLVSLLWLYSQSRQIQLQYLDQQGLTQTLILSVKDRDQLAMLMKKLFAQNNFAYTILGSKPISWENYQNPLPFTNWTTFYDSFSGHHRTLRAGWKTWEKYRHLFPNAHFMVEYPECYPGSVSILIINEDRFNDVVNINRSDFQEVLCREVVDGFQLIKEAKNRSLMNDVLEGHQALLGIVLGYGRDNSWKFSEGCKTRKYIGWVWGEGDEYLDEEFIDHVNETEYYYLSLYSCPSFAGDPNSAESKALKSQYLLTKQMVLDYYKGKDFLEATLSLLAGYKPQTYEGNAKL